MPPPSFPHDPPAGHEKTTGEGGTTARQGNGGSIIRHINHTASRWALLPVLLVVWMAPFLGGSVEAWAKGVLYCLLAVLFICYPVSQTIKLRYRLFLVALALLPLTAFLPVAWLGIPEWRSDLTSRFSIAFPKTISAQPWLALDSYLAWLGGLAWIYWLGVQGWTREIRKPLAELFAVGMVVLTAVGLIGFHTRHPLPFWHAERLFGPFPNRNQTANLLALTFVLLVALLHMAMLKKSRIAPLWMGGLIIVGYGLVVNFSRAGILLPVLGVGAYWFVATLTRPSRKMVWIGIGALLLAVATFLVFGGETLARFSDDRQALSGDFRQMIFRDTWAMISRQPWAGVGLAGFPFVFPMFRKLSAIDSGIIHPESDWLWLASEVGWPGTFLVLSAALWFVWRAFCGAVERPHPLRLAGAICGGLFVLHGFFDVSGHRFGTFFPACFLFGLAWPGQSSGRYVSAVRSYGIALALALIGTGWFVNMTQPLLWPSRDALARVKKTVVVEITHGHGQKAFEKTDGALLWAPLDWELYYQRGTSRILLRRDWAAGLLDYQRTNYLERFSPIPPENEGMAWLSYRPDLAALSWAEALSRMPDAEGHRRYARYLELSVGFPRLRAQLEALGGTDVARSIIQLNQVEAKQFDRLLAEFLLAHPKLELLKPADQRAFFDIWVGRGNPADVLAVLQKNPKLLPACNLPLASARARLKEFQPACELAFRTLAAPIFPNLPVRGSEAELNTEFYSRNSLGAGIVLCQIQMRRNDSYGALSTLERLKTLPDAPIYLRYFEARLHAGNGSWEKAWNALDDYIFRNRL